MKIRVKEVTKTVPLLVDPEPGWMALVNHGANQEPFNSLKSETGERTNTMAKGKAAKRDGVLTQMNFSKDKFKDEAAVQKFLDDNNITDCEVEDEDDVFVAKSTTLAGLKLNKAVSTSTKFAGVTAFIAEPKEAAADDGEAGEEATGDEPSADTTGADAAEDVTAKGDGKPKPAPKTATATKAKSVDGKAAVVKTDGEADADDGEATDTDTELRFPSNKYDFWGAYMSNEGSLLGVLKDGIDYDGLPPGVDEVISAVYYSTGNVLSGSDDVAAKKAALTQIGEDFAALTMGLYELFDQATEDSTKSANNERKAKAASFVKSFSESVTRASKAGDNVIVQPTAKGHSVTVDIADADDRTEEEKLTALIGKAVDAAVAPMREELSTVKSENVRLTTELSRSTSRRSDQSIIDNLGVGDADEDDDEEAEAATKLDRENNLRSIFGVRPRANAA